MQTIRVPDGGKKIPGSLWVVSFIISPTGNAVLVGWDYEVDNYRKTNYPVCFTTTIYYINYRKKAKRNTVIRYLYNYDVSVYVHWTRPDKRKGKKYIFNFRGKNLFLRRPPDHWIPEYDDLLGIVRTTPIVKEQKVVVKAMETKVISDYPHKCPHCGEPSYNGTFFGRVDCSAKCPRSKA